MNASMPAFSPVNLEPTARSVRSMMVWVLIALLPGIAMRMAAFGFGVLWRIGVALAFAVLVEALLLQLRGQSLRRYLFDGSAAITAVLLVLCLPPTVPWWIVACGVLAALAFGKHLYGGLGRNPFNPAMLGVAVVLLCFSDTLAPTSAGNAASNNQDWFWIAGIDALGGCLLLWLGIVRWQTPLAVLAGAALCAAALGLVGDAPSTRELFAGNLVLAAFFVASDPVSGCVTPRGRWIFGSGVGLSMVLLQRFGSFAGAVPFAVLLMNGAAPWIDTHAPPRRLSEQQDG